MVAERRVAYALPVKPNKAAPFSFLNGAADRTGFDDDEAVDCKTEAAWCVWLW